MKKLLLLAASAVALAACTFPQTKMEPVGAAQTQPSQQRSHGDSATSAPASAQSAAATR
jgi:uncharacterized lipoprotein YajG